jgi:hypothetical protein
MPLISAQDLKNRRELVRRAAANGLIEKIDESLRNPYANFPLVVQLPIDTSFGIAEAAVDVLKAEGYNARFIDSERDGKTIVIEEP